MNKGLWPIERGDIVDVRFINSSTEFSVKIKHLPNGADDIWVFEREDGTILYVKEYESVICSPEKNIMKGRQ